MRCGVMCDAQGNIIRTWALVSDAATYAPEQAGDEVVEWEADHGANEPHAARRDEKVQQASQEKEQIAAFRTKDEVLDYTIRQRGRLVQRRSAQHHDKGKG